MLKSAKKIKKSPKVSLRYLGRYFQRKFRRHPVIATIGVTLVAIILCASPYYLSSTSSIFSILTGGDEKNSEATVSESVNKLGDITSSTKTKKTNVEETDKGEDSIDISREGVGKITKPTPRCQGAGCPTANPSYSIVMNRSISIEAGTTAGPFTATTSNGSAVNWSTPVCMSGTTCPYGFTNAATGSSSTFQYYLRAEQNVPPGNYTLYISTIQPATETIVKTTMTVTVSPHKDFQVSFSGDRFSVDRMAGEILIPFTITRISEHTASLSTYATITPNNGQVAFTVSALMTSTNAGRVLVTVPNAGIYLGDYTVTVGANDGATTHTDQAILQVY